MIDHPPTQTAGLQAAVGAEAVAAEQLAAALAALQRRAETRDSEGLEPALAAARAAADQMARAGSERMRLTVAQARALGMEGEPSLAAVAERVGSDLIAATAQLAERLRDVAQRSAVLGICTRFGAVACERLQALQRAQFGLHDGYGADGRLGGTLQGPGRRA